MPQDAPPITINHPSELPGAPLNSELGFDHACIGCEYNLLGIAIGGVCPECSTPVTSSLKRRLLRNAPASTITALRDAARNITIAALLPLVLLILGLISALLMPAGLLGAISLGVVAAIWLLFTLGWYRLTQPLAGFDLIPETDNVRRNCRIATLAFSLSWVAMLVVTLGDLFSTAPPLVSFLIPLLMLVCWMVQLRLGAKRVQQIALAIPSKGIARYSRAVYWVLLSNILLAIGSLGAQWYAIRVAFGMQGGAVPGVAFAVVNGLLTVLLALTTLAGYAMYIGLFRRLWIGLSKVEQSHRADQESAASSG